MRVVPRLRLVVERGGLDKCLETLHFARSAGFGEDIRRTDEDAGREVGEVADKGAEHFGEGGSGGALGIGVGNQVIIMENAYYSVITPEGCAAILWKDRAYSEKAAEALHLTASDLLKLGLVDGVIKEPLAGAHRDYDMAAGLVKTALRGALKELQGKAPEVLKAERYEKFRKIAFYSEKAAKKDAGK